MKTMFSFAIKTNALVSYGLSFKDDEQVNRLWRAYDGVSNKQFLHSCSCQFSKYCLFISVYFWFNSQMNMEWEKYFNAGNLDGDTSGTKFENGKLQSTFLQGCSLKKSLN